jgi:hypothetical protein
MSTIDLPDGFLTRPEAAKVYNRSQRALERDLEKALALQDQDSLTHWKLVTKGGEVQDALGMSTEQVDQLVAAGMVPTWCVSEVWLEETYAKKGSPKPGARSSHETKFSPGERQEKELGSQDVSGGGGEDKRSLSNDVEFLMERIRNLEREKREEAERNERREAKLFTELDVKNKQIAAWDEISQGLTKALATGRITPMLPVGPPDRNSDEAVGHDGGTEHKNVHEADVITEKVSRKRKSSASIKPEKARSTTAAKRAPKPNKAKPSVSSKRARRKTAAKNNTARKPAPKRTTPPPSPGGLLSRWFRGA